MMHTMTLYVLSIDPIVTKSRLNKRNNRVWEKKKPQYWNDKQLYGKTATVNAALKFAEVVVPLCFQN